MSSEGSIDWNCRIKLSELLRHGVDDVTHMIPDAADSFGGGVGLSDKGVGWSVAGEHCGCQHLYECEKVGEGLVAMVSLTVVDFKVVVRDESGFVEELIKRGGGGVI